MQTIGFQAVITIVFHFFFIVLAFHSLKALRIEQFIKPDHVFEAQLLLGFIAISLGYTVSSFVLDLITQSRNLMFLF